MLAVNLILGYISTLAPPPLNKYLALIRGVNFCTLRSVWIGHRVLLDNRCPHLIHIGSNVTIANDAKILAHFQPPKSFTTYSYHYRELPVRIGSNVYIGCAAIILPGCSIGNFVIIGAGSVVTKDIPNFSIVTGNPGIRRPLIKTLINEN